MIPLAESFMSHSIAPVEKNKKIIIRYLTIFIKKKKKKKDGLFHTSYDPI